jgi:hypothetical protein
VCRRMVLCVVFGGRGLVVRWRRDERLGHCLEKRVVVLQMLLHMVIEAVVGVLHLIS